MLGVGTRIFFLLERLNFVLRLRRDDCNVLDEDKISILGLSGLMDSVLIKNKVCNGLEV